MKDLPHHMQKLNRRIIRDAHREALANSAYDINPETNLTMLERSKKQSRKQQKAKAAKKRLHRTPISLSIEEENKLMQNRIPRFYSKNHQKPKTTRSTRKKTPQIHQSRKAA